MSVSETFSRLESLVKQFSSRGWKITFIADKITKIDEVKDGAVFILNIRDALKLATFMTDLLSESNFIFVKSTSVDEFEETFATTDIPIISNVFVVAKDLDDQLDIWSVYRPAPDLDLR